MRQPLCSVFTDWKSLKKESWAVKLSVFLPAIQEPEYHHPFPHFHYHILPQATNSMYLMHQVLCALRARFTTPGTNWMASPDSYWKFAFIWLVICLILIRTSSTGSHLRQAHVSWWMAHLTVQEIDVNLNVWLLDDTVCLYANSWIMWFPSNVTLRMSIAGRRNSWGC